MCTDMCTQKSSGKQLLNGENLNTSTKRLNVFKAISNPMYIAQVRIYRILYFIA